MNQVIALENYRRTSEEVAAEANHRIANNLAMVVAMIEQQIARVRRRPGDLPPGEVASLLRDSVVKIVSIAHLHRRLAETPGRGAIDMGDFLAAFVRELVRSLSLEDRLHVRQLAGAKWRATGEQAQVLALIVGEIVTNALKYAHPAGLPVYMDIVCTTSNDGGFVLEIGDDGVGLPEGFDIEHGGGVGFGLIRTLAAKMHAELKIKSDELGLCFCLTVPSAALHA